MTEQPDFSPKRRSSRRHVKLGGLVASLLAALIIAWFNLDPAARPAIVANQPGQPNQPGLDTVTHIDDGDTIIVRTGGQEETVRLIGLDTPEVKDPRKPVQCFGEAASAHTKAVIAIGSGVRLASDPEDSNRDKYGRLLRYVYLPDGTLFNEQLIQQGYGFAYVVFPFTKLDQFRSDETIARQSNLGLWAACNVDSSPKIKQTAGNK